MFGFMLMLYITVNTFSTMSGHFLGGTRTKQRVQCHVQGYNVLPPVSLEPATLDPMSSTPSHCAYLYTV